MKKSKIRYFVHIGKHLVKYWTQKPGEKPYFKISETEKGRCFGYEDWKSHMKLGLVREVTEEEFVLF